MMQGTAWYRAGISAALALTGLGAQARPFVSPAGYSGTPRREASTAAEPGAPALTRIPDASLAGLFRIDPTYMPGLPARMAHVSVVGAFRVSEPTGAHVVGAWAPGFLPVTLSFSDGRCYLLAADYVGGTLSNGRLTRTDCEGRRAAGQPSAPPPPALALGFVGSAWGYNAWFDERRKSTVVTAPRKTYEPLFTADMATVAIMAMNGPDSPGGNITLVGRIKGQLTVVTLEVGY